MFLVRTFISTNCAAHSNITDLLAQYLYADVTKELVSHRRHYLNSNKDTNQHQLGQRKRHADDNDGENVDEDTTDYSDVLNTQRCSMFNIWDIPTGICSYHARGCRIYLIQVLLSF